MQHEVTLPPMDDLEFALKIKELLGEWTAPSEVAAITAELLKELWAQNKRLQRRIDDLQESVGYLSDPTGHI